MEYDPLSNYFEKMVKKQGVDVEHRVIEKTALVVEKPSLYEVLLMNDDFTPMGFVVELLQTYFNKPADIATAIMLQTHQQGQGNCGIFTKEVAETKMIQVISAARECGYPLKCIINKTL